MSQYNTARVAFLSFLSFCGIAVAQDRITVTNGPAVSISPKKGATSLPTERATYLGIATSPASAAIREQLKLPKGIGVVVERVEKNSPAEAAGIKQYDIVEKFGDQLLVDGKQLAVLVRMNEPGAAVPLSIIRQGQREQVNVTLTEKVVPVVVEAISITQGIPIESGSMTIIGESSADATVDVDNFIRQIKNRQATVSIVDGETYNFRKQDGSTNLRISDKGKSVLFEGPVNNDDDLKAVPAEYQEKVKRMMLKTQTILGSIHAQTPAAFNPADYSNATAQQLLELTPEQRREIAQYKMQLKSR